MLVAEKVLLLLVISLTDEGDFAKYQLKGISDELAISLRNLGCSAMHWKEMLLFWWNVPHWLHKSFSFSMQPDILVFSGYK